MKKNDILFLIIGLVLFFSAIIYIVYKLFFADIWAKNADKLNKNLCSIEAKKNETIEINDISKYIPFEWDTLYTFKPYVSIEKIYEVVGYKWDKISIVTNEGMNQLVFLKDGKVVCYVYGYPKAKKVYFDFGDYEGDYLMINSDDILNFKLTVNSKGIRNFEYIQQ